MYLSQRLFSFKTRAPESMHAVQQGFFPAQTQCLMMYSLKYYAKDWAFDEGRTAGFATPRDGSLLGYKLYRLHFIFYCVLAKVRILKLECD